MKTRQKKAHITNDCIRMDFRSRAVEKSMVRLAYLKASGRLSHQEEEAAMRRYQGAYTRAFDRALAV